MLTSLFLSGWPEFQSKAREGLHLELCCAASAQTVLHCWTLHKSVPLSECGSLCCFMTNKQDSASRVAELTAEYFLHVFLVTRLPTLLRCWRGTWCVPCAGEPLRLSCSAKSKVLEVTVPEKQAAASRCWGVWWGSGTWRSTEIFYFRLFPDEIMKSWAKCRPVGLTLPEPLAKSTPHRWVALKNSGDNCCLGDLKLKNISYFVETISLKEKSWLPDCWGSRFSLGFVS